MNIGAYAFIYLVTYFKITVMSPILPQFLFIWILIKYSMYLKCLDTSQKWIPHIKSRKQWNQFMSTNRIDLEVQPHIHLIAVLLDFKPGDGHLKPPVCSASFEN